MLYRYYVQQGYYISHLRLDETDDYNTKKIILASVLIIFSITLSEIIQPQIFAEETDEKQSKKNSLA